MLAMLTLIDRTSIAMVLRLGNRLSHLVRLVFYRILVLDSAAMFPVRV